MKDYNFTFLLKHIKKKSNIKIKSKKRKINEN